MFRAISKWVICGNSGSVVPSEFDGVIAAAGAEALMSKDELVELLFEVFKRRWNVVKFNHALDDIAKTLRVISHLSESDRNELGDSYQKLIAATEYLMSHRSLFFISTEKMPTVMSVLKELTSLNWIRQSYVGHKDKYSLSGFNARLLHFMLDDKHKPLIHDCLDILSNNLVNSGVRYHAGHQFNQVFKRGVLFRYLEFVSTLGEDVLTKARMLSFLNQVIPTFEGEVGRFVENYEPRRARFYQAYLPLLRDNVDDDLYQKSILSLMCLQEYMPSGIMIVDSIESGLIKAIVEKLQYGLANPESAVYRHLKLVGKLLRNYSGSKLANRLYIGMLMRGLNLDPSNGFERYVGYTARHFRSVRDEINSPLVVEWLNDLLLHACTEIPEGLEAAIAGLSCRVALKEHLFTLILFSQDLPPKPKADVVAFVDNVEIEPSQNQVVVLDLDFSEVSKAPSVGILYGEVSAELSAEARKAKEMADLAAVQAFIAHDQADENLQFEALRAYHRAMPLRGVRNKTVNRIFLSILESGRKNAKSMVLSILYKSNVLKACPSMTGWLVANGLLEKLCKLAIHPERASADSTVVFHLLTHYVDNASPYMVLKLKLMPEFKALLAWFKLPIKPEAHNVFCLFGGGKIDKLLREDNDDFVQSFMSMPSYPDWCISVTDQGYFHKMMSGESVKISEILTSPHIPFANKIRLAGLASVDFAELQKYRLKKPGEFLVSDEEYEAVIKSLAPLLSRGDEGITEKAIEMMSLIIKRSDTATELLTGDGSLLEALCNQGKPAQRLFNISAEYARVHQPMTRAAAVVFAPSISDDEGVEESKAPS